MRYARNMVIWFARWSARSRWAVSRSLRRRSALRICISDCRRRQHIFRSRAQAVSGEGPQESLPGGGGRPHLGLCGRLGEPPQHAAVPAVGLGLASAARDRLALAAHREAAACNEGGADPNRWRTALSTYHLLVRRRPLGRPRSYGTCRARRPWAARQRAASTLPATASGPASRATGSVTRPRQTAGSTKSCRAGSRARQTPGTCPGDDFGAPHDGRSRRALNARIWHVHCRRTSRSRSIASSSTRTACEGVAKSGCIGVARCCHDMSMRCRENRSCRRSGTLVETDWPKSALSRIPPPPFTATCTGVGAARRHSVDHRPRTYVLCADSSSRCATKLRYCSSTSAL